MEVDDLLPRLLGGLGPGEEIEVVVGDHPLLCHLPEVDDLRPVLTAKEDDRHRLHAVGLAEGEGFEHLVEGSESAGEEDYGCRAEDEVKLPQREVLELEAEVGRDEGIGLLLGRELDVEPDRLAADVEGPAVGGFHDSRPAAGDDDEIPGVVALVVDRHEPGKLPCCVVVMAAGEELLGPLHVALQSGGVGIALRGPSGLGQPALGGTALDDLRAPEDDYRRMDPVFLEGELRFVELKEHPHTAGLGAVHEEAVVLREAVARTGEDRIHVLRDERDIVTERRVGEDGAVLHRCGDRRWRDGGGGRVLGEGFRSLGHRGERARRGRKGERRPREDRPPQGTVRSKLSPIAGMVDSQPSVVFRCSAIPRAAGGSP